MSPWSFCCWYLRWDHTFCWFLFFVFLNLWFTVLCSWQFRFPFCNYKFLRHTALYCAKLQRKKVAFAFHNIIMYVSQVSLFLPVCLNLRLLLLMQKSGPTLRLFPFTGGKRGSQPQTTCLSVCVVISQRCVSVCQLSSSPQSQFSHQIALLNKTKSNKDFLLYRW